MKYKNNKKKITPDQLKGFFVGWAKHPNSETHLKILKNSFAVWLAFDGSRCVGFINAISDGIFYSYIPLLEVLPDYKGQGIGTELVKRMLKTLKNMYAIDIVCDESIAAFYKAIEFKSCVGMVKRNYDKQNGTGKL
ncbi:MAG: GNAT family N-acetyltransferase [Candidatus Cloacimonetes bacterium]|nr:GNAT family N-acetyltransferase [Candidatus Cloacimonadota bacterium]